MMVCAINLHPSHVPFTDGLMVSERLVLDMFGRNVGGDCQSAVRGFQGPRAGFVREMKLTAQHFSQALNTMAAHLGEIVRAPSGSHGNGITCMVIVGGVRRL